MNLSLLIHIPIVKHHHHFLHFIWLHKPYHWEFLPFWLAMSPRVFTSLITPIISLCQYKGFHVIIYLDDILILTFSKYAGKRAQIFCAVYFFVMDCILILPSLNSISSSNILFQDHIWIQWLCLYPYHLTKLLRYSSWLSLCYWGHPLQSIRLCPFWERLPFMPMDTH